MSHSIEIAIWALTWEYAAQYKDINGEWEYPEALPWRDTAEEARSEERALNLAGFTTRLVRRLVSQPEEVQP